MKHSIFLSTIILLASLTLGACSKDDDDTDNEPKGYTVTNVAEEPNWQVDWTYNQSRPDWQEPVASDYENWTVMLFKIEDALRPYVDENDLMAVFVGDELRGLAKPAINLYSDAKSTEEAYFLMKAYGNDSGQTKIDVTLRYYSSRLQHFFTLSDKILYQPDEVYGVDKDLIPQFTLGAEKFKVKMPLQLSTTPLATSDIKPAAGDIVAAFVGNECRGILTLDNLLLTPSVTMNVFGYDEGESVSLKYYDAKAKCIYTFDQVIKLK